MIEVVRADTTTLGVDVVEQLHSLASMCSGASISNCTAPQWQLP
ncbi:MAG: hypothetical protein ACLGHO_10605 [Gammaproteobacteria bacterium]